MLYRCSRRGEEKLPEEREINYEQRKDDKENL